ncbi:MAG: M3 family oligoendopeptidase [Candidatus Eisenbacteria bacterium]|nr:M3 family oligoendopeptidase [Candidatus Eisenbacteria bacterium]
METVPLTEQDRERALSEFIGRLVQEIEPLHLELNQAVWNANVTGDPAHEAESARLDARLRMVFSAREPYRFLCGIAEAGGATDPLLSRQLVLLLNSYRAHQIAPAMIERMVKLEKKLESRFNNFRALLDGERVGDNALRQVLRESQDPAARRRAWEASKQIGSEVVAELVELVGLRNQAARELGFDNYYSMMLTLDELDERELFALLDDLDRGTRVAWDRYKGDLDARLARRFGVEPAALRPWHYGDPFFQEAPATGVDLDRFFQGRRLEDLTERFYRAVGFEIGDLLARADLYEKPGKSQHAFCLAMDRKDDIRVLCNLRPNEYWMGTMLHEFGHAVYDKYVDRTLPFLLRAPAHTLATEASAMLFGRLSKNAAWLERWAGVPADEARAAGEACARAVRDQLLVQTRWMLVMCSMERALYRDPAQDLNALWWDLVERFQSLRRPDGRDAPDWASKLHFSVAPVYYHNYMLGEMMASQLQDHLQREVLRDGPDVGARYVSSPEVGRALIEKLYRGGRTEDWRGTLRRATGGTLSAAAFVSELEAGA